MDRLKLLKEIDTTISNYEKMYDENIKQIAGLQARQHALKEGNKDILEQIKKLVDKRKAVK